ncbi:hypothetical protein BH10PSE18_BH10PSE18_09810 [soil metagenome]
MRSCWQRPASSPSRGGPHDRRAERLYGGLGWQRCGVVPGHAPWPDGGLCGKTIFFKPIEALTAP